MGEHKLKLASIVHYIGPYSDPAQSYRNLLIQPSGVAKMEYIISAIRRSGCTLNVYSPAPTQNNFFTHFPRLTTLVDSNAKITYADTIGGPAMFFKALSRLWSFIQLFLYLLRVKPNENVLVYHVYQYRHVIKAALLIKKIRLFFEVEEIYSVLWQKSKSRQEAEIEYLGKAFGYIFVNDVIAAQCKFAHKPNVVCYGDYRIKSNLPKSGDGRIHLVYSGVIGGKNSSVDVPLKAIRFLTDNYQLHITGYGEQKHLDLTMNLIASINADLKREAVVYHGCLDHKTYINLISSFHIGLATSELNPNESLFMFPSKILMYLGVNLSVVASPLACIEKSQLGSVVTLSKDNTPAAIAEAIRSVEISNINNSDVLKKLDEHFVAGLTSLFNKH